MSASSRSALTCAKQNMPSVGIRISWKVPSRFSCLLSTWHHESPSLIRGSDPTPLQEKRSKWVNGPLFLLTAQTKATLSKTYYAALIEQDSFRKALGPSVYAEEKQGCNLRHSYWRVSLV